VGKLKKILCVGGCVLDILVVSDKLPLIEYNNKTYFGIEYGSKIPGTIFIANEGGSATNIALNLVALGVECSLFSAIGDDFLGNFILDKIKNTGLDCSWIVKVKENTGTAFIVKSPYYPDRGMITVKAASDLLRKEYIDINRCDSYDYLIWCSLTSESSIETIEKLIELFRNRTDPGFIIAAPSSSMIKKYPRKCYELVLKSDLYASNLEEAKIILKMHDASWIDCAKELFDLGINYISITNGEEGAIIGTKNNLIKVIPPKIDVVDTTGVGDAFISGFIYGLINEINIETSGKIATLMSICVLKEYGTRKGIPRLNKINKLLQTIGPNIKVQQISL